MVDYYPNKTQAELEVMLKAVQDRNTKGTIYFTTAAGVQNQRSFQGSGSADKEILRLLFSLHQQYPLIYPDNPYHDKTRLMRPAYTA